MLISIISLDTDNHFNKCQFCLVVANHGIWKDTINKNVIFKIFDKIYIFLKKEKKIVLLSIF
jgi:hypothetical protein